MALALFDRVQETTTTTGTGSLALAGAVSGFQSFAVVGNTNTCYYTIVDGSEWEVGIGTYSTTGPTLARTTVLSNSSGNTSPITLTSGSKQVFLTYPAEKSVNLDASDNVSPLGTVNSGTWQGTTVGVAYGGTGVTASSGANSVMIRDANQNVSVNRLNQANTQTTAAGGTTTLTAASTYSQTLKNTGSQIYQMPDATTLATGVAFIFNNNATGLLTLQDYAAGAIGTITSGGAAELVLLDNSTVGGTWDVHGFLPEAVTWGTNALELGTTIVTGGTWNGGTVQSGYGGTGLTTFAGANNALYSTGSSTLTAGTLPVLAGGTGTTTPSLVAGANITVTGTWPNQTIDASGGGGGGAQIGEIYIGTDAPSTGTWLETGEYYSKATYPNLASAVGDVEDYKNIQVPQSNLFQATTPPSSSTYRIYCTATNGTTTVIIGNGGFKYSTDGLNWTPALYGTNTISFEGIRYLNGNFVAFGTSGTVIYSADGISWKSSYNPGANVIQDIAFGSGVYVAINNSVGSQSGGVWYSSDLITWTQPEQILLVNFSRIAYGNGVFVACGVSGVTYSSPNGITWTLRSAGSATVNDVVFINNEFVQVGAGGSYYRSTDGASWSSVATGAADHQSVIYQNGIYVLFGSGCTIRISTDGITYSSFVLSGYNRNGVNILLRAIVWNGTNFIGVSNAAGIWFAGTSNGTYWAPVIDSYGGTFSDVSVIAGNTIGFGSATIRLAGGARYIAMSFGWAYQSGILNTTFLPAPQIIAYDSGLNLYVAASTNGITYYSSDAETWTAASVPSVNLLGASSAACENGRFFILSLQATSQSFFTSANGTSWTSIFLGVAAVMTSVAYGAGVWVVVGQSRIVSSPDGTTWTARVTTGTFTSVIFANGLFVAVGVSGVCQTSTDGITWTSRTLNVSTNTMWKVVYDNSLFVATGAGGYVTRSANGLTWTAVTFTSFIGYSIAYSAPLGLWCIVGSTGGIATSPDAATWTIRSNNAETTVTYYNVFWQSGQFYIGTSAGYRTSANGIVWLRESSARWGLNTYYTGYAGGKFVMVDNVSIQSSADGVTWKIANNINVERAISDAPTRFYKLGGYYYTCSVSQMCISSDGITWRLQRFPAYGARRMAYSGSVWLMVVPSTTNFMPTSVYRSTDGVNWSKVASFGQRIFFSGTQPGVAGLVYASGRFVLVFDGQNSLYGNQSAIYTSTDGLSWAPTSMSLTPVPRTVASDGTNIVLTSSNFYQLFKSSDGGLNWELLSMAAGEVTYTNGVWVFAHPNTANVSFISTDLVTFKGLAIPQAALTAYSKNGYLHLYSNTAKFLAKNDNPAFVTQSMNGNALTGYTSIGSDYADPVERGNTLLVPSATLENRYPWLAAEIPAFSYNTATTFWVPTYGSGGGQKAWIYAGP